MRRHVPPLPTSPMHVPMVSSGALARCCLQAAGGGPVGKVDVYRCTGGATQKWTLDAAAGTLCSGAGSCVAGGLISRMHLRTGAVFGEFWEARGEQHTE